MSKDYKDLNDEDLVMLFKNGDEKAFNELYCRYAPRVKKLVYYNLGDLDGQNDVSQEVFLRVYRHIGTFKTNKSFSSWIYKIAVNCSKNYRNIAIRNDVLISKEKLDFQVKRKEASPEELFIKDSDIKEFYQAIDSLQEKFKIVFVLRYDYSLGYREISKIADCSERTAKWRMQRAIEKIVDYLKEQGVV